MIQWMQRHKKYLIITIWISTIAFVGAGFVGWGQYSYGDKAGSVAKVGNVTITMGELQKTYSDLYSQYNKMFQGNFDEEKAKSFGLQKQALKQLLNQALVLNLALSYDLEISDAEVLAEIKSQDFFYKDGVFNKEIYKEVLLRNNRNIKEYETDVRKELLIQKTLKLLPVGVSKNEEIIIDTIVSIADKIDYKVLNDKQLKIDTSDAALKPYWETSQQNFMSEVEYEVAYIKQKRISSKYEEGKILEHYNANKTHFKDVDSKLLPLEGARASVIIELNDKATKDAALRGYIAYKKDKLRDDVEVLSTTISASNNTFGLEAFDKITKLSLSSPYLKPVIVNDEYFTFKLIKVNPSKIKSFEEAKKDILSIYINEQKRVKLIELAKSSIATFKGTTTDFITNSDAIKLTQLKTAQANEFLISLFSSKEKRGFVTLKDGNVVLYNILEQKLLSNTNTNPNNSIVRLKSALFNEGLIKNLQNKYKTEIFIEGL
ncbi:peptidylprolyl isomerase [Sulfurimonas sp.]|uniref:peptidylprolyl isomerase n=1 Tax=Sulfurimonas sp. TaxID=2022749 RepID=UPI002AB1F76F|nr:SurA N-terminal domain-containing protein [Sulfurimonas sp.]